MPPVVKNQRVHCSLNLNTETGRLSSRRPNLQNQPALEKDQYKIRDAFVAEEGKTLIVADYGQLELRILAHITNCNSMIEAFRSGGCFHSRTAVGMYPHVKAAVDNGDVLLEWDYSKGQPTVPLVKDTFASERRKAKTLNFSIAYGKTVHGLAQDWAISKEEAQETLDAWYRDRPEVKRWQEDTRKFAIERKFVETIMGRRRDLPDASKDRSKAAGHALRAAINTPIQGRCVDPPGGAAPPDAQAPHPHYPPPPHHHLHHHHLHHHHHYHHHHLLHLPRQRRGHRDDGDDQPVGVQDPQGIQPLSDLPSPLSDLLPAGLPRRLGT